MAERLRGCREEAGLSRRELAERSGVPERSIVNLERGEWEPSLNAATSLAKALGVSLDWLAGLSAS